MKYIYRMFVIIFFLFFTANIFAQAASITWGLSSTTQLTSVSTGNVTGVSESMSSGSGQYGMSIYSYSADGQRLWEGTAGWMAGTEEASRYIQFNALFTSGISFNVTNVSFNYGAAGLNGHIQSNVYYSTDGWQTRTLLSSGALSYPDAAMLHFSEAINVTITSGTTFSVRIYPYSILNSVAMSPTFAVHNSIVISGTTISKKRSSILVPDISGKWGKSISLTARLQDSVSMGTENLPGQIIRFSMDSVFVNSGTTDANGYASVSYTVPQDSITHSITASYAGDANYSSQNSTARLTVQKHVANLTVAPTIYVRGVQSVIVATLTDNDNSGSGINDQPIRAEGYTEQTGDLVYIGSGRTNSSGVVRILYNVPQDSVSRSIKVSFAGDAFYDTQIGMGTLKRMTVMQISNTSGKWGKSISLSARLQDSVSTGNINLSGQVIRFSQDSVYINSGTTNASGIASIMYTIPQDSVSGAILIPQDSVMHSISASYVGDANYSTQSCSAKLAVIKHTTNVTVPPQTAVFGQAVTFTASLMDNDNDGNSIHNQVVKFYIVERFSVPAKETFIGSGTTNSSGIAGLMYSIPGTQDSVTRSLKATFTGDVNYKAQTGTGSLTYRLVGIERNRDGVPTKFDLLQNYPNPFNPTSTIRYQISEKSFVSIRVYDILGKEVGILTSEEKSPGFYEVIFDAKNLASGIYLYTIRAGNNIQTKKMILLR